jgi:hypothetical protein
MPAVLSLETAAARQFQAWHSLETPLEMAACLPLAAGPLPGEVIHVPGDGLAFPFLTAQDVLYTLHILRC